MLHRLIQLSLLTVFLMFSPAYAQGCQEPVEVTLPDGATVKSEAMIKVHKAMLKYIADAEAFLQCLEDEERSSLEPFTFEQKKTQVTRYNNVVDKMHQLAKGFNNQLAIYKSRNSKK